MTFLIRGLFLAIYDLLSMILLFLFELCCVLFRSLLFYQEMNFKAEREIYINLQANVHIPKRNHHTLLPCI